MLTGVPAGAQCDEPGWLTADRPTGAGANGESAFVSVEWDPDGPGPLPSRLVIGGAFYSAGGRLANGIAQWDGDAWSPMGDGLRDFEVPLVLALHVHNGELYAGGRFLYSESTFLYNIARWDGASWLPLGDGVDGTVQGLTTFNGDLIVCGGFDNAGNAPAARIARWDGTQWHPMGDGFDGYVASVAVFNGSLYACGAMEHSGSATVDAIGRWNGTAWENVGGGLHSGDRGAGASSLAVFNNRLVVAGRFSHAGLVEAQNVAQWTGSAWQAMGSGVDIAIASIASVGSELFGVTPWHRLINGSEIDPNSINAYRWNGTSWMELPHVDGSPSHVTSFRNEAMITGNIYADADSDRAGGVLRFDGVQWRTIGEQGLSHREVLTLGEYNGQVTISFYEDCVPRSVSDFGLKAKLVTWDDGAVTGTLGVFQTAVGMGVPYVTDSLQVGADLYVCGRFDLIDDQPILNVAKWDGKTWSQVGDGIGPAGIQVQSLALFNGEIVAGGAFLEDEGSPGNSVVRWSGQTWERMGTGLQYITDEFTGAGSVSDLLVHEGRLLALGGFTHANGLVANNLAIWDGVEWSAFAVDIPGAFLTAGISLQGDLVVTGIFTDIHGAPIQGIARWDGTNWNAMGEGLSRGTDYGYGSKMAEHGDDLYVTGFFTFAGGAEANNVAKWDGDSWSPLGAGLQREIYQNGPMAGGNCLLVHDGQLLVGGVFNSAGGDGATNFARYCLDGSPACIADFNRNDVVDSQDFFDFLAAFFMLDPRADVNDDEAINSQDFFDFLAAFFGGC